MPIADDNPRRAPRYWLTVHHPIGGALKYDLDSLDPDDPAAVAAIAVDLEERGLHWPPPGEFAEANLRRFRAAELAGSGTPADGERACDEYARLEAKWAGPEREERAERGRQREERGGRDFAGVRVGPPEAAALKAVSVTVRELRPVDAQNRPAGAAYRLEYDELSDNHDLKDPRGVLVASAGVSAWGWASIHAAGDMRARGAAEGLARFRVGPPETLARTRAVVTARQLQPVDNRARPLGGAYRLAWDEAKRVQRLEDPRGALLGVVRGKGFEGAAYGLCWAERLVERDLRRGPRRGFRAYEVSAEVDGGPRDGLYLGTAQVDARTSAGALQAVPARRFAAGLDPDERGVRLTAAARDDPDDRSHAALGVPAKERGPERGQPGREAPLER